MFKQKHLNLHSKKHVWKFEFEAILDIMATLSDDNKITYSSRADKKAQLAIEQRSASPSKWYMISPIGIM